MGERAVALAFLAGSGLYIALSFGFPFGTTAQPGPGYFPMAVGVFLCLVAAVLALATFRRGPARVLRPVAPTGRTARERIAAMSVGLVGYCLLLPWIGYPAAAFGLVALLLRRLGSTGWALTLGIALVGALGSYYVFGILLSVPLPMGIFTS